MNGSRARRPFQMLEVTPIDNGQRCRSEPVSQPHGPGLERSRGERRSEGDDAGGDLPPP